MSEPALLFWIPCIPPTTTHQRKQIARHGNHVRLHDAPALVAAKQTLGYLLAHHAPVAALRCCVRLDLAFVFPHLASTSKRDRARGLIRRVTKPDCSNLAKTLEDRLVEMRFIDCDQQVAELLTSKFFGHTPGIAVAITPIDIIPPDVAALVDQLPMAVRLAWQWNRPASEASTPIAAIGGLSQHGLPL